jgi:hypothetical protein
MTTKKATVKKAPAKRAAPVKRATPAVALSNGKVVKPSIRIETVSPERAEKILSEQNIRNRDLRQSRVEHLAGIISRDEWKLTGDAIVFDLDGVLLNGQHRLTAAVAAERPIEVAVLRNVPRVNQDVMDDTLSRRLGDALKLRGETDQHALAAGINWFARLLYAEISGAAFYANNAMRPSIPQLLEFYATYPGLKDALVAVRPLIRTLKLRPGPAIAVRYRFEQIDPKHAEAFFDSLRTGASLPEGSPILALRRYVDNERDRTRGSRRVGPDFKWVAVTIKAWNAWREGRPVNVLAYTYTPLTREQWPVPE